MVEIKHQFTEEVLQAVPGDSLAGANLAGVILAVGDLAGLDLQGANLEGANLAVANLADANLGGCNLRNADLTGAVLTSAKLTGADLRGANLTGADLGHAALDGADFGVANLTGANLTGADLSGARLHAADLTNASLNHAVVGGAVFDGRTQFPALFFDPEGQGAVRDPAGETITLPTPAEQPGEAAWASGEAVLESLFQRAGDGTLSLSVRTADGWLVVDRPTEPLAGQLQQALGTAGAEARAYRDGAGVGLVIRAARNTGDPRRR